MRCLLQFADEEEFGYPLAAYTFHQLTYVDDEYRGGDTINEAIERRNQMISILKNAVIELRK